MSDKINNNSNDGGCKAPVRVRSRFPKAQPNIGLSSGINRIRRLSGHYNENEKPDEVVSSEKTNDLQRQNSNSRRSGLAATGNENANQKIVVEEVAAIVVEEKSKILDAEVVVDEKVEEKIIENDSEFMVKEDQTTLLLSTLQQNSNYNPRFTKEHIMNIIKFKALQKLKKIESDVSVATKKLLF